MTEEDNESKKPLTRDQILKAEKRPKEFQLPSGMTVQVGFLSLGMVQEIEKSIESAIDEDKEQLFTEKVISWILRANEQKELLAFSEKDQHRLIEIAVEEWGCEEEYEQFADIENPQARFYQAVQQQEKELAKQLSESVRAIKTSLASTMAPLKNAQMELASSLKGMLGQFGEASKFGEVFSNLNARAIEQMGDIYRLQSPILSIVEEITKLQRSSLMTAQSTMLESLGGTITSYQNLMKDVLPVERFSILPDSVRYYPTIEMRNTSIIAAHLVDEYTFQPREDIITPDHVQLLAWLESLDPAFSNMLLGAEQAIYSQNPDHLRHFASSHRELSTHILHLLAPNDQVKKWTKDPNHFDKDGKPTRKARLKFIARYHNNKTFVDFLIKDFENQMALLNADEHRESQEYTDQELNVLH
ncbi:MAG: pPIWI-associating nuclease domain-containing protein, partial [Anaerolineaceae bacterium]